MMATAGMMFVSNPSRTDVMKENTVLHKSYVGLRRGILN